MFYIKFLFIIPVIFISILLSAQTGTINIFSEVKGIEVYIDEEFKGKDIKEIANVQKGTHYLKILKDTVTIYEQIALVEENSVTTIVLKDTPDIAKKLLVNKKNEIAQYDSLKLTVDNNQNFYQGKTIISMSEFAKLTGNKELEKKIDRNYRNYKNASILANAGGVTLLLGLAGMGLTFSSILFNWPDFSPEVDELLPYIGTASILTCLLGYGMTNAGSTNMGKASMGLGLITFEDALLAIVKYNSELKTKLGVPETYK